LLILSSEDALRRCGSYAFRAQIKVQSASYCGLNPSRFPDTPPRARLPTLLWKPEESWL